MEEEGEEGKDGEEGDQREDLSCLQVSGRPSPPWSKWRNREMTAPPAGGSSDPSPDGLVFFVQECGVRISRSSDSF